MQQRKTMLTTMVQVPGAGFHLPNPTPRAPGEDVWAFAKKKGSRKDEVSSRFVTAKRMIQAR
jgi:hypothetical protein